MTAVGRSEGPRPGGIRRGEGEREDHENTLPLVGRVLGQVRLYEERGRGGGEQRETGTTRIERELERSSMQAQYPVGDWRRDEGLTTIAGGAVSRGHHINREGRARARGAGLERLTGTPLIADLGLGVNGPRAWHRKGEGGNGKGP